jgi:hypothetical protein
MKNLTTYKEAVEEANKLNAESKKYWEGISFWDMHKKRKEDPSAPFEVYHVQQGLYTANEICGDVYLSIPGALAGDSRIRNEDGTLYVVTEEEKNEKIWSIMGDNYSDW